MAIYSIIEIVSIILFCLFPSHYVPALLKIVQIPMSTHDNMCAKTRNNGVQKFPPKIKKNISTYKLNILSRVVSIN